MRDQRLCLFWDPVVAVLQPQAVPVDGGIDVAVVRHLHCDLRALVDVQCRAWDRAVVAEHAHHGVLYSLAHGMDAYIEGIAVVKAQEARARRLRETRGFGRERVLVIHILSFHCLRSSTVIAWSAGLSSPVRPRSGSFGFA